MKQKIDLIDYIETHTLRCEASYRGGGIEISLNDLLGKDTDVDEDEFLMTAYQNYLGGGMLGAISSSYNFNLSSLTKKDQKTVSEITEALKRYFHNLTNHEDDEWESATFEENQNRPGSAY